METPTLNPDYQEILDELTKRFKPTENLPTIQEALSWYCAFKAAELLGDETTKHLAEYLLEDRKGYNNYTMEELIYELTEDCDEESDLESVDAINNFFKFYNY